MIRPVKFFLFLNLFIIIDIPIFSYKLSRTEFYISNKYLSPNNDGFQDYVYIYIILNQDKEIKVKKWELSIYNSSSLLVQKFTSGNQILKKKYTIPWDGKDQNGNIVQDGKYEIILTLDFTYGSLQKQYSIDLIVNTEASKLNIEFKNPVIYTDYSQEKEKNYNPVNKVIIQKNFIQFPEKLFSYSLSYILDKNLRIVEKQNWKDNPRYTTFWNGKIEDKTALFSVYHYSFLYKTTEEQFIENLLPGMFVLPFSVRNKIQMNHTIMNEKGYSFHNENYIPLKLENIMESVKESQTYCLEDSLLLDKWNFIKQEKIYIHQEELLDFLKKAPKNQYCVLIFFDNPIPEKLNDFYKIYKHSIYSVFPFYVDEKSPKISLKLLNEELRLDINYVNNYQKIDIFVKDNTIISFIDIKIYLDIPEKKILIKKYRLNPRNSLEDKNKYEIFWNGDSIQKEIFESEDRFKLEIEAIDIAGNQSIIISQFKNDLLEATRCMIIIPIFH